jgi:chaperonin GroES
MPYGERVLIKKDEVEKKSAGGIILQEESQELPVQGKVVGVGSFVYDINVGDIVIFGRYAGNHRIDVGDEVFHVVDTSDIKAVIR